MIHVIALAVVLQMSNIAEAPDATVARAQAEVARLYGQIGVDVAWVPDAGAAPLAIRVVVMPAATGSLRQRSRSAMGAAVRVSEQTHVAYVFYRQVQREATGHDVSTALLLACAIAHELGHLLLPDLGHSPAGLMRAYWDRDDFCRANQGHLRFSSEQAALIRERLAIGPSFTAAY
jgi:hypothetical protein